jgi:hypothetical protein
MTMTEGSVFPIIDLAPATATQIARSVGRAGDSVFKPWACSITGRRGARRRVARSSSASRNAGNRCVPDDRSVFAMRMSMLCQERDQFRLGVPGMCHGGPGERAGKGCK